MAANDEVVATIRVNTEKAADSIDMVRDKLFFLAKELDRKKQINIKGILDGLEETANNLNETGKKVSEIFEGIDSASEKTAKNTTVLWGFVGIAVAKGLMNVAKGVKNFYSETLETAKKLDKTDFMLGLSPERQQKLSTFFKQNGANFESFLSAYKNIQSIQAGLEFGQMSEGVAQTFGRLGINPSDYKDTKELLDAIGRSLLQVKDVGQRNLLANALGVNQELLYVMEKGVGYYNEYLQLSDEEIKNLGVAKQKWDALGDSVSRFWDKLKAKVSPGIARFLDWGIGLTESAGEVFFADWLQTAKNQKEGNKPANLIKEFWDGWKKDRQAKGYYSATDAKAIVYNTLKDSGMSDIGIAGVMGNVQQESSFDSLAINSTGHKGLFQWDKSRWADFEKWAAQNGMSLADPRAQTLFAIQEENGRISPQKMNSFMNISDATAYVNDKFERSGEKIGDKGYINRQKYAREIFSDLAASHGYALDPNNPQFSNIINDYTNTSGDNKTINNYNQGKVYINTEHVDGEDVVRVMSQNELAQGSL